MIVEVLLYVLETFVPFICVFFKNKKTLIIMVTRAFFLKSRGYLAL
jgi:hypothetical protein